MVFCSLNFRDERGDNRNNRKELERSALAFGRQGYKGLLQFLDLETWRQRLLQLLGLFLILDYQSVKESGASNLELGAVGVLLDFDALCIFPAGLHEEVLKNVEIAMKF